MIYLEILAVVAIVLTIIFFVADQCFDEESDIGD